MEGKSIVSAINFNLEHSVCVFKNSNLCPIVAKTSVSAMDVYVYKICGFEAAKVYILQMTPI